MFDQDSNTVRSHIRALQFLQVTWGALRLDRPMTVGIGLTSQSPSLSRSISTSQSRRRGISTPHLTNQAGHGPVEDQDAEVLPEAIPGEATTIWEDLCIRICIVRPVTWSSSHHHRELQGRIRISKLVKILTTRNKDQRPNKNTRDQLTSSITKNQSVSWRSSWTVSMLKRSRCMRMRILMSSCKTLEGSSTSAIMQREDFWNRFRMKLHLKIKPDESLKEVVVKNYNKIIIIN